LIRFDPTLERGAHIMELLHSIEEKKDPNKPHDE
jgi:hypothetical protein